MDNWYKRYNHTCDKAIFRGISQEIQQPLANVLVLHLYLEEEASASNVRGTFSNLHYKFIDPHLGFAAGTTEKIVQAFHQYEILLTQAEMKMDPNSSEYATSLQTKKLLKDLRFPQWDIDQEESLAKKKERKDKELEDQAKQKEKEAQKLAAKAKKKAEEAQRMAEEAKQKELEAQQLKAQKEQGLQDNQNEIAIQMKALEEAVKKEQQDMRESSNSPAPIETPIETEQNADTPPQPTDSTNSANPIHGHNECTPEESPSNPEQRRGGVAQIGELLPAVANL